jgi:hypothetical protein
MRKRGVCSPFILLSPGGATEGQSWEQAQKSTIDILSPLRGLSVIVCPDPQACAMGLHYAAPPGLRCASIYLVARLSKPFVGAVREPPWYKQVMSHPGHNTSFERLT